MHSLLISAAHKSSGKTTISTGLCAALVRRKLKVQPFKKGPDYIDPAWLGRASGKPCLNLDFNTQTQDEILGTFNCYGTDAEVCLVEANKGLYDGLSTDGSDSNAALAELLGVPVILVIDCQGMTRGIAPLLLGYSGFAQGFNIAGVILNKIGGSRHESKLRSAVETYTDMQILGAVHKSPALMLPERHLGLVPSNEQLGANDVVNRFADSIEQQVDIDKILELSSGFGPAPNSRSAPAIAKSTHVRIGIAKDSAFGFYYPDDLNHLRESGAELIEFSPISDSTLPEVDALFIGGGFPETHMNALEQNIGMREQIRNFVDNGGPAYAECGGLMYLARTISWKDQSANMCAALPLDISMHDKSQGRGYVKLTETSDFPWPGEQLNELRAHEFHYSRADNIDPDIKFAYKVSRGAGINGTHDGIVYRNVFASYAHQRHTQSNPWTTRFVQHVKRCIHPVKEVASCP